MAWWHHQPIADALAGIGGSAIWRQELTWPFDDNMTYSQITEMRDQGELPAELLSTAWQHWCREPEPGEQKREV